jgi:superfamily II DNA helicase RecQ
MDPEVFDKALEKLVIHGGCAVDFAGNATRGHDRWRSSYAIQVERRRSQIELVIRFLMERQCRMAALVRHFGDFSDARRRCGLCDCCVPQGCIARTFHPPNAAQRQAIRAVLDGLRSGRSTSTGKLHEELFPDGALARHDFEDLVAAMANAGMIEIEDAIFEKDGRSIPFRRVRLRHPMTAIDPDAAISAARGRRESAPGPAGASSELTVANCPPLLLPGERRQAESRRPAPGPGRRASGSGKRRPPAPASGQTGQPASAESPVLEQKMRAWRLAEAHRLGVPAFCIFADRTLRAIALSRPVTFEQLRSIEGIGDAKVQRFGAAVCQMCAESVAAAGNL